MKLYVLRVESVTKHEGRAARHAAYQRLAPGVITWRCATCGGSDHGTPTGVGFSVSTASHDGLCLLVVDEPGRRIGVDLTSLDAPAEFDASFPSDWARREAIGKASGVGVIEEPDRSVKWCVDVFERGEFMVALASDHPIDLEVVET